MKNQAAKRRVKNSPLQLMVEEWEKISDMGVLRGSFAHMAMQGLVPLLSGAMMVTGAILHRSVKVFAHD